MTRFDHVVIRASAGTGKTYQLTNRFLGLLVDGAPVDQILATTFTRKAAGEIMDRVVTRLAEAAGSDAGAAALAEALGRPEVRRPQCVVLLRLVLRNLHRLRVCTLDSFFSQIASSFSLELGLPPGWRIVEQLEDDQLRTRAIEEILRGRADGDIVRLMHLVTKGDAERSISDLVRHTVRGLYDLYAQTGEQAWQRFPADRPLSDEELAETIAELRTAPLPDDARFDEARAKDLDAIERGDWERLLEIGLTRRVLAGESTYYRKPIPPETAALYLRLGEHVRAELVGQLAAQTAATFRLLDRFDKAYRKLKDGALAMRFEDVTRRLAAAATAAAVPRLEYRLDSPISHLLLDEFQDTSLPQWLALRAFAERVTLTGGQQEFLWQGGQQSFFCVGDVKQAIYGWRGGKSEIFEALEAHLDGLRRESLNQSFRSSQPVIDVVNRVFQRLPEHPNLDHLQAPVESWCESFRPHTTARGDLPGYVRMEVGPRPEEGSSWQSQHWAHSAERIAELSRAAPDRSVGVLVRRNSVVAELIFHLRQLGVEASEEGGNSLNDSAAVQLLMSLLRLADHPGDTIARFHVAQSPLGPLLDYRDHQDDAAAESLSRTVRARLMDVGYGPALLQWSELLARHCGPRDGSRLEQLVRLAYAYQHRAGLRTSRFVDHVAAQRIADPSATAAVRVMTVHQAKGLQFDCVVLAELDGRLVRQPEACVVGQADPTEPPDRVCLYRNKGIQSLLPPELQQLFVDEVRQSVHESLCVLYVAMTRAVHALHLLLPAPRTAQQSMPKTHEGLLRTTLAEAACEPDAVLLEHGDPQWHAAAEQPAAAAPAEPAALTVELASMPDGRHSGLQRTAPSGLEGGARVKLGSVLRLDNAAALARGTMIHAWFEQIRWLDDGLPTPETLRRIAAGFAGSGLNIDEVLRQFHAMLQLPEISGALRRDAYSPADGPLLRPELRQRLAAPRLEVHNERRFAVRDDEQVLSGTIDRLVLIYDGDQVVGADVIDFKTDAVSPEDPDQVDAAVEHYRPQQEAYRSAVAKMFDLDPQQISAHLLLLSPGIVKDL